MAFVKSSLCKAVFLVAFTLGVQKTAAQSVLCDQYGVVNSTSGQYIIQNNAWGADNSGTQCTTVDNDHDGTSFSTTWSWGANDTYASQTQVHSFPNIKSNSASLPLMLSNITSLTVSANWSMYPSRTTGTDRQNAFDLDGLEAIGAKADVILDFFLDPDIKQSTNVVHPKYEVMIWFASLAATEPIGYSNGSVGSTILDGKNYTLYTGQNNQTGQLVFGFLAPSNATSLGDPTLDILPLFAYLVANHSLPDSTYLGTAQFGTETFHTAGGANVTFAASGVGIDVMAKSYPPPSSSSSGDKKKSGAAAGVVARGLLGRGWVLAVVGGTWVLWSWVL